MVKHYDRGDIVTTCFNPAEGREQKGDVHPALVLSKRGFNNVGTVLVAPITQGGQFARERGFTINLMGTGLKTQGVVLLNQCKMLDLEARGSRMIEKAPAFIVDEALDILQTIID